MKIDFQPTGAKGYLRPHEPIKILGVLHHCEAVQVFEAPLAGVPDATVLQATNRDLQESVEAYQLLNPESRPQTVEIPGHVGRWMIFIYPHAQ